MSEDIVYWRPEHDGHRPPYWAFGMPWDTGSSVMRPTVSSAQSGGEPAWYFGLIYCVPREAVHGQPAAFNVEAWLDLGRANTDKLPAGVALPQKKTWADVAVEHMHNLRTRSNTDGQQDEEDIRQYLLVNFQPREPQEPNNA